MNPSSTDNATVELRPFQFGIRAALGLLLVLSAFFAAYADETGYVLVFLSVTIVFGALFGVVIGYGPLLFHKPPSDAAGDHENTTPEGKVSNIVHHRRRRRLEPPVERTVTPCLTNRLW